MKVDSYLIQIDGNLKKIKEREYEQNRTKASKNVKCYGKADN